MIVHHGQVKSITLDEIEGAYKIATIHVGHPSNFLWGWEGLFGRSGGVSDCEELSLARGGIERPSHGFKLDSQTHY